MMERECSECMSPTPMMHWHYEEMEDFYTEPVPAVGKKLTWEDLLNEANEPMVPQPKPEPEIKASLTHTSMRLDGADFICDACGAVSGDFELFEEVGVEVACKPPVSDAAEVSETEDKPKPRKPGDDLHEYYKKLLAQIEAQEKAQMAKRSSRMIPMPKPIVWEKKAEPLNEMTTSTMDQMVFEHIEKKRDATHKTRYIEMVREMQRRERRK